MAKLEAKKKAKSKIRRKSRRYSDKTTLPLALNLLIPRRGQGAWPTQDELRVVFMSHRLIVNPGTPEAWAINLQFGRNGIGSAAQNEVVIPHASVSAQHCELTVADDGVLLRDLESASGTFISQVPVTEFKLQNGHRIQLGAVELVFESHGLPVLPDAVNLPADGARILIADPSATTLITPRAPIPRTKNESAASADAIGEASVEPATASFWRDGKPALIGALLGALAGVVAWFYLVRWTGQELNWFACVVGVLTGVGARWFIQTRQVLPTVMTCAFTAVATLAGTYLTSHHTARLSLHQSAEKNYQARLQFAQAVSHAGTMEEIRQLLAAEVGVAAADISDVRIQTFQATELPALREFARGRPDRETYLNALIQTADLSALRWNAFQGRAGLFTLLWLLLGVGVTALLVTSDRPAAATRQNPA